MYENIISPANAILATIIYNHYHKSGIHFITPDDYSQQVAFMSHPAGKEIEPHAHNPVERSVSYTNEVLIIRKGKLRVDFFDDNREYLESRILVAGDLLLLISGGHGFEVLEDLEMFEVKQGPYAGDKDKTRFKSEIKEIILRGGQ